MPITKGPLDMAQKRDSNALLACVLALTLGCATVPAPAWAAGDGAQEAETTEVSSPVEEVATGEDDQQQTENDMTEGSTDELVSDAAGQASDEQASSDDPEALAATAEGAEAQEGETSDAANYANQWVKRGDDYYFFNPNGSMRTGWLVTTLDLDNKQGGLQRYWLQDDGKLARDTLISAREAGYWAYARPEGYVVRGKWTNPTSGYVYLADGDGKLEDVGWRVSNRYGDGLQRYFIDHDAHACVPGYAADGWDHYTLPAGYVLRGRYTQESNGFVYLANNDGKLEKPGWLVSDKYGQKLQRYYIDAKTHACVPGYSTDGYPHFTLPEGYVLRGVRTANGVYRFANNDGRMAVGWVVTNSFGQGLQRYWQQDGQVVADQLVQTNSTSWAYARPEGYVARGRYVAGNGMVYLADNNGKLENTGWLVSKAYDSGLQRFFINPQTHAAQVGFFNAPQPGNPTVAGSYYGVEGKGYVLRGKKATDKGILIADNNGLLAETGHSVGWMITKDYDGTMQRYLMEKVDGHLYAKTGFFTASNKSYYGLPDKGYVLRGKQVTSNGVVLANNDGVLAESGRSAGWMVSKDYDSKLQRYYLQETDGHLYAKTGFFKVGDKTYYGMTDEGYVLRGKMNTSNGVLIANNDGVLAENSHSAGWMVTSEYDGGAQRYYMVQAGGHLYARTGMFTVNGKQYYGSPDTGYVVRNGNITDNGVTYLANNDGVLAVTGYKKTRDPYVAKVTWTNDAGYKGSMVSKAIAAKASYLAKGWQGTNYCIVADKELCRVTVLQKSGNTWTPISAWNSNMGYGTRPGYYRIEHKSICNWADEYFGKGYNDWSSCFIAYYNSSNVGGHLRYVPGKGYEDCQSIHSTGYEHTGYDNAGCIGVLYDHAKWVYDTCPVGTWVIVF